LATARACSCLVSDNVHHKVTISIMSQPKNSRTETVKNVAVAILLYPIWIATVTLACPCILYVAIGDTVGFRPRNKDEREWRKQRIKALKSPKPMKRAHVTQLSAQGMSEQTSSMWFQLPLEMRWIVYKFYFGSIGINIGLNEKSLTAWRNAWGRIDALPLLQTCKRM
jgi:hypothetical protein